MYGYYYINAKSKEEALGQLVRFRSLDDSTTLINPDGVEIDWNITSTNFLHCKAHNSGNEKDIVWSEHGEDEWLEDHNHWRVPKERSE